MKTININLAVLAILITSNCFAFNINGVESTSKSTIVNGQNNIGSVIGPSNIIGNANVLDRTVVNTIGNQNNISGGHLVIRGNLNTITSTAFADQKNEDGKRIDWGNFVGDLNYSTRINNSILGSSSKIKGNNNNNILGTDSSVNANNSVLIGNDSTNYRDNTVSIGKQGNERQLTNLAQGEKDTDAVNVKQLNDKASDTLNTANSYTDNIFNQFNENINRIERKLNASIAGVTAISSIPYVTQNNFSYGIGLGYYKNGQAIAAGMQIKAFSKANIRFNASWDNSSNSSIGFGIAGGF